MEPNYIAQLNSFHIFLETHYLSPQAQLLWFKLIGLFNACGWADWVLIDTCKLMGLCGVASNKAALRARDELVGAGLLSYQKGRKGKPNRYRMTYFLCTKDTENDTVSDTENDTENGTKTTIITKQETKQNETKKRFSPPRELEDAWRDYAQMRKRIRKPLTDRASELLVGQLEKLAPGDYARQNQILNRSTMHAWQGLFPLPDEPDEAPRSYDLQKMERQLWEDPVFG